MDYEKELEKKDRIIKYQKNLIDNLVKQKKEVEEKKQEYYKLLKGYEDEACRLRTAKRQVKIAKEALEIQQKVNEREG